MFAYVAGAIVGAIIMGRTKPKTQLRTLQILGPRTGIVYTVEVMPGDNVVVLHAPGGDNTIALFQKGADNRYHFLKALQGFQETVTAMRMDMEP